MNRRIMLRSVPRGSEVGDMALQRRVTVEVPVAVGGRRKDLVLFYYGDGGSAGKDGWLC